MCDSHPHAHHPLSIIMSSWLAKHLLKRGGFASKAHHFLPHPQHVWVKLALHFPHIGDHHFLGITQQAGELGTLDVLPSLSGHVLLARETMVRTKPLVGSRFHIVWREYRVITPNTWGLCGLVHDVQLVYELLRGLLGFLTTQLWVTLSCTTSMVSSQQ